MQLERLLSGLTERMGWDAPPLKGEDGKHVLEFDDGLRVTCEELPGRGFLLTAPVTDLPGDAVQSEALLRRLLKLTLPRMKAQRAVLCLDAQAGSLCLYRRLDRDADLNAFQDALETLLNNLDFWRRNSGEDRVEPAASPFSFLYP